jgi:hypothetical protein
MSLYHTRFNQLSASIIKQTIYIIPADRSRFDHRSLVKALATVQQLEKKTREYRAQMRVGVNRSYYI